MTTPSPLLDTIDQVAGLVPGSAALRGITAVLQKQMQPGLEAGATVLLVALAMMTGLLLAHALVPSRLEL